MLKFLKKKKKNKDRRKSEKNKQSPLKVFTQSTTKYQVIQKIISGITKVIEIKRGREI